MGIFFKYKKMCRIIKG